jgi:hypothetical protein
VSYINKGCQSVLTPTHGIYSLQDEMFQKFNFDTEWAVRLISKITNDEDLPIEGGAIVKQVIFYLFTYDWC